MSTSVEPGSGQIRKAMRTIHAGTPNEKDVPVGRIVVRSEARFNAFERTPFGPTDAINERRAAAGKPKANPFFKAVAEGANRVAAATKKMLAARKNEVPAAAVVEGPKTPEQELAEQLEVFKDDPEMQSKVFAKWQKKQTQARLAAATQPVPVALEPEPTK